MLPVTYKLRRQKTIQMQPVFYATNYMNHNYCNLIIKQNLTSNTTIKPYCSTPLNCKQKKKGEKTTHVLSIIKFT